MKADSVTVGVVLLGDFDPSAFMLPILEKNKAIGASDISSAKYETLARDQIVDIHFSWGRLCALQDRFLVETTQVPYIRVADLASKCLREIAPTSIVKKMGINVFCHFKFDDWKKRDQFGARLMPPLSWGSFGSQVASSFEHPPKDPRHGGAILAVMRQGCPDNRKAGWIDARVEPSIVIPENLGVLITINDHYEFPALTSASMRHSVEKTQSDELLSMLEELFDSAVQRGIEIAENIITGS